MRRSSPRAAARPLVAAVLGLAATGPTQDPETPNVVLVLVDDLGWADLACQGSRYHETPNIDRLAAEGVRFTDAYAACAVCSPTRAALLTGRSPARTGVTDWIRARFQRPGGTTPETNPTAFVGGPRQALLCPPNPFWLEPEEVTLAEVLRGEGYATCHVGKWHLGDEAFSPEHQGFDENHGGCDYGQPPSYFDPYRTERLPQGIPTLPPREAGEYLTDREADEAVDFIRRNRDRPFFLYLAHYAVHTPLQAKADLTARYAEDPKTAPANPTYAAMVHSVDAAMGRVLGALDEAAIAERTLVIFTSDNGGLLGPTSNAPLRSGKGHPYEGGIRVPFLVRWPAAVAAGRVSPAPVTSVDVFATVLAAVGAPPPRDRVLDSVSLLPHLRAGEAAPPARPLFWHFPHYRGDVGPYGIVRDGAHKLIVRYEGPRFELFDLARDPGEAHDLAATEPDRVARMHAMLLDHLAAAGAKMPRPNPDYRRLPRVLLLGDSISIGYTDAVRRELAEVAEVFRPMQENGSAEKCEGTTRGLARIDAWLGAHGGEWDVVHFNFGLHDLKHVDPSTGKNSNDPTHPHQAAPNAYERNLRAIVAALERSGARLVFATTTPVPPGRVRPYRAVEDVARYNTVATAVMAERGIAVNDLYAFALPRLAELQRPVDVHFTPAGSQALAAQVAASVRRALPAEAGPRGK
jgi:arylsulfatase A-like enzyme/lysophospholipase L1-like esterase